MTRSLPARQSLRRREWNYIHSHPLEIGALGDREALEVTAQAVEAELDRTQAHPVAAAIDARAAGFDAVSGGDREVDAAAEIDTVGAVELGLDCLRRYLQGLPVTERTDFERV